MEKWKADLHQVLQLPFQHLSLYSLTVEEHSLFGVQGVKQASDELEYAMYAYAIDELKKHGFTQYEIANFAKAGARSKHNQVYWRYENFHGIGCGARKTGDVMTTPVRCRNTLSAAHARKRSRSMRRNRCSRRS